MGGIAEVLYSGENRPRLGNVVYGLFGRDFVTRDGRRTMIVVVTPRQWANMVAALGIGDAVVAIEASRGVSLDRERVVPGKNVSVRVDNGGGRILQKKK